MQKYGEDFALLRDNLDSGDFDGAVAIWYAIHEKARDAVWVAPTKLPADLKPMLTTEHRKIMQTNPAWAEARGRHFANKPKEAA